MDAVKKAAAMKAMGGAMGGGGGKGGSGGPMAAAMGVIGGKGGSGGQGGGGKGGSGGPMAAAMGAIGGKGGAGAQGGGGGGGGAMAAVGAALNLPAPAAPNIAQLTAPLPVIGPQFCCPYVCDLKITSKMLSLSDKHFDVMDVNDNLLFKLKGHMFTIHDRRHLVDAAGNVVATLKANLVSLHDRWQVFRGESNSQKDLIFTAKRTSVLQFKTHLDVYLAREKDQNDNADNQNNAAPPPPPAPAPAPAPAPGPSPAPVPAPKNKRVPDYRVSGSWNEKACSVYFGDSKTVAAQMAEKITGVTLVLGKDHFGITVYPFVDYAFICSLIIILDAINKEDRK